MHNKNLKEWLEQHAVSFSHHEYAGINDLSLIELGALKVLVEAAIHEKISNVKEEEN